jgi:hypothetical protein
MIKKNVGLWIDHKKAVIVTVEDDKIETTTIDSHVEKQPGRHEGVRSLTPFEPLQVPPDGARQREFTAGLNAYYARVIDKIGRADSILIFGPGEAKGELEKRLESAGLKEHVRAVETVDKMTDRQIAAKVREHLPAERVKGAQFHVPNR